MTLDPSQLSERSKCKDGYVFVIGDVMLDVDTILDVQQIDQTAPAPLGDVVEGHINAGGAANTALNLVAMGVPTRLFSFVQQDPAGQDLLDVLIHHKAMAMAQFDIMFGSTVTATTVQERFVDSRGQLIARARKQDRAGTKDYATITGFKRMMEDFPLPEILVLVDYGKGIFDKESLAFILDWAKEHEVLVVIDPHPKHAKHPRAAESVPVCGHA